MDDGTFRHAITTLNAAGGGAAVVSVEAVCRPPDISS